jgi:hypothetical protein
VLVAKYRKALDAGPSPDTSLPYNPADTVKPQAQAQAQVASDDAKVVRQIEASVARDLPALKPMDDALLTKPRTESSGENQPLIRLPERQSASVPSAAAAPVATTTQSASLSSKSKAFGSPQKVIFASGGIVTGEQALEVLNAGASVAMCYTGVVYGGIGTISQIKDEMRQKINAGKR